MAVDSPLGYFMLFVTGFAASIVGSLVGLGGGFIVVPILRLAFSVSPAEATSASLLLVFANTASASIAFLRHQVVEIRSGLVIAAAGIPAGVVGALVVRLFTPRGFDMLYGAFLISLALLVTFRSNEHAAPRELSHNARLAVEIAAGIAVGFFSSLFGIGGGIVLVPVLLIFLRLPVHIVAGTSAFVVTLTSPSGILTHALAGHLELRIGIPLVVGGLIGGNIGARLARHVSPRGLSRLLAAMLFAAALALVAKHI